VCVCVNAYSTMRVYVREGVSAYANVCVRVVFFFYVFVCVRVCMMSLYCGSVSHLRVRAHLRACVVVCLFVCARLLHVYIV